MPHPYKHPNRRLTHRTAGGQFRRSTLADIGMATCEKCGAIFAPQLPEPGPMGLVDPKAVRDARRFCPEHARQENAR